MANPALKLAPEAVPPEADAPIAPEDVVVAPAAKPKRGRLRVILLVVVPVLAAIVGLGVYLAGGRYISTDNAFVGAQKVLITPDISGKINRVVVREGQRVAAGDVLFELDPEPFRIALTQAQARVANVRIDFANLKTNLESLSRQIELSQQMVALKQRDLERKSTLLTNKSGSQADVDTATSVLAGMKTQLDQLNQQAAAIRNQLSNDPALPIEKFPAYMTAAAALEQAQRDLDHTVLRSPIAGTATQVDSIQLGRYLAAGTPVLSVIDDQNPWVDANPKETDITYLRVGQPVEISVDTFPDHVFHGTVISVSPGTGAQFAILPPQNASGNWVKVVQRVPLRIAFDANEDVRRLRAGMSVTVSIDSGRRRSLGTLLGLSAPPVVSAGR